LVGELGADRRDPLLQRLEHRLGLALVSAAGVQPAVERVELGAKGGHLGGNGRELSGFDGWLAPEEAHDGGHRTG
jgi:hypothetical protein